MLDKIQKSIWQQFGASIDMLLQVIQLCPAGYFETNKRFYYLAYHSVVFLDYYLTVPPKDFSPLLPFTFKDMNERPPESIGDMIPDRIYSKEELVKYIHQSRVKCKKLIDSLSDAEKFDRIFSEGDEDGDMNFPVLEILLYNLRHTQHHTGQLSLFLRQDLEIHTEWAFRVDELNS